MQEKTKTTHAIGPGRYAGDRDVEKHLKKKGKNGAEIQRFLLDKPEKNGYNLPIVLLR